MFSLTVTNLKWTTNFRTLMDLNVTTLFAWKCKSSWKVIPVSFSHHKSSNLCFLNINNTILDALVKLSCLYVGFQCSVYSVRLSNKTSLSSATCEGIWVISNGCLIVLCLVYIGIPKFYFDASRSTSKYNRLYINVIASLHN